MIITKESLSLTMFATTGCTILPKLISDKEFIELAGLVRLKKMGGISAKMFSTLFLAGINPILYRNGIITEYITKLNKNHAIDVFVN